jgi:biopolymer transport protein ExbD
MLLNIEQHRRKTMISLTPLIDVVFILLLFFMLSSTFSRWQQIPLQTPAASESQTPRLAVLKIQSNTGEIVIDGNTVRVSNADELQRIVQQYAESRLVLMAAKGITVQTIVNVMDALKQSGASHISFAGTEQ